MRPWLSILLSVGCLLGVLDALGDPPHKAIDASRALDAGAWLGPGADMAITSTPPDPPALVERRQWIFDLRWDRGQVFLLGVRSQVLPKAEATPRAMGRFALELYEGPTLFERVRFDFPLLGGGAADAGAWFSSKLRTRIGVVFPATDRGTRLELWDRATSRRWGLPWPPNPRAEPSEARDAGSPSHAMAAP